MQASPCVDRSKKATEVRRETHLSPAHVALSSKLQAQFQEADSDDDDASQDWFVNDRPAAEKTDAPPADATVVLAPPVETEKRRSVAIDNEDDDVALRKSPLGFLHLRPVDTGVLIMELCLSDQTMLKQYGAKYFKIYLPQVTETQQEFCLYGRSCANKLKIRFSLSESKACKRNNPGYAGKLSVAQTPLGKRYKMVCPHIKQRSVFTLELRDGKHELDNTLLSLLRGKAAPRDAAQICSSVLEKFANPLVDVKCPKTATSWLRIDKEGKFFVYYTKPFSMFQSAAIAVAVQSSLLE
ncbi:hypothetical protein SPRG_04020 [Saprolegnia parasitica CBS 223.65]|uniref:Tubby C-terminal domain-containing protein n=1 Tax=Saprolegnia parasitica (strain CBS 223.65) TaxID=695850 RepID=A0A067CLK8_SAPPC|nr:hypothetical protein SPRG_04020 [Saprolegnia parasitica CBS 223.65]KDO31403.1 hypothetical protein SPRG_04020 [Saprolegnia parasitica CBS 223.65]|eukprot:XP_012198000.1 hypothetical protein SPRG_04020 [Saprolegnia parasitica CBS 223.65]